MSIINASRYITVMRQAATDNFWTITKSLQLDEEVSERLTRCVVGPGQRWGHNICEELWSFDQDIEGSVSVLQTAPRPSDIKALM